MNTRKDDLEESGRVAGQGQAEDPDRGKAAHYRLQLIGGQQAGASECIETDRARTLGSGFDNDIVVLDSMIDEVALVFDTDADGVLTIEVRGGELERDDAPLEGQGPHRHVERAVYRIGSTRFTLTGAPGMAGAGSPQANAESDPNSTVAAGGPGLSQAARSGDEQEDTAASGDDQHVWLPRFLFGVAAVLCVAIGVSYLLHGASSPDKLVPPGAIDESASAGRSVDLETELGEAGFDTVTLAKGDTGARPRLIGYVPSRQRLNELRQWARGRQLRADIRVHVQNDIVEGVRDVYRTNGVRASVEPIGPGAVRVTTAESEPRDPGFMQNAAMEDVAGLVTMEARNELPPAASPEADQVPQAPRPQGEDKVGKQVVAIVKGDPSYVVTRDDSRYFVGSLLPTGHTIEAIDDQSVMLDWRGQKTSLDF